MVESHEKVQELFWGIVQAFRDRARVFSGETEGFEDIADEFGSLTWRGLNHLFCGGNRSFV